MGEIVDFDSYVPDDVILFSGDILEDDEYLQLITMNILSNCGYGCDKDGIIYLQKSLGIEPTGIISEIEFEALLNIAEEQDIDIDISGIRSHYNEAKRIHEQEKKKEEKEYKRTIRIAIIWLFLIAFFSLWGFASFIRFIMHLVLS